MARRRLGKSAQVAEGRAAKPSGVLPRFTESFSPEPGEEADEDFGSRDGRTGSAEAWEDVVECHFEKKRSLNVACWIRR